MSYLKSAIPIAIAICLQCASAFDTIVVFNEIHYHPADSETPMPEFVELHNQNAVDVDLSGWRLSGGVEYDFPAGTVIPGGGYVVVTADTAALAAAGVSGVMGPYTGVLNNNGETLRLRNNNERIMDEVEYDDRAPWPIGADGSGASLAKLAPDTTGEFAENWGASLKVGGTPGAENFSDSADWPLRINEISGTSAAPEGFFVEISNSAWFPISLEKHVIALEGGAEHVIAAGLTVPGNGMIHLGEAVLGFRPLNGDSLYLHAPGKSHLFDALRSDATGQARYPDGKGRFYFSDSGTPGSPNAAPAVSEVVINEIMYHHRPDYAEDGDPPAVSSSTLLDWSAAWRFNEGGDDLGSGWAQDSHATGGNWEFASGPFGYETSSSLPPVSIATELTQPGLNSPFVMTYYFETEFNIDAATFATISQLNITHQIDDGAIFYLNGHEIGRYDMPEGDVNAATSAKNDTSSEANSLRELTINSQWLLSGSNRFSVEVHQINGISSDVVMGLKVEARQLLPSADPPVPYCANDEEWIELFNRGAEAVDVGGWSLDGAVQFAIPAGTTIPGGGYLVLARDMISLLAKFPGIECIGDFSGSLGNDGERLFLLDASGNPADELFYRDDAPWPSDADGGGSSLELRNPRIDNSTPDAWRASANSTASEWKNYEFTLTANTPTFTPGIYDFHELRIGMLDAGVVLIDDFSVIEEPGGTNIQLIANRTFNSAAGWRMLGTHLDSGIVSDHGENVLKLAATARMSYLNNLLECNLTHNGGALRPVRNGVDYRISFRAKWLSGSPRFRFEFYYNKLAKVVVLEQPETCGTPGARNSTYESDTGPGFLGLTHSPAVPEPGENVVVSTAASDPDGIRSMTLRYSVNGGAFVGVPMTLSAFDDLWNGTIPTQSAGSLVQFYVEGEDDGAGRLHSFAPARGPDSRAIIEFETPGAGVGKQTLRLNMLAAEASAMHESTNHLSNHRYGCTIIVDETRIAYDSGIRMRGSMWTRRFSDATGLNLKLPSDRRYRGVHSTITVRKKYINEVLVKHILNQAGGLHDCYNDVVYQYGHTAEQNGITRLEMARFGSNYLEGLPGGDGNDGTVFKMEGIRVLQETQDGTPDTPKIPFPNSWVNAFDFADQGDDKEMYRHNLPINTSRAKDDYSSMIRMSKAFELTGQALEDAAAETIDVDMFTRQFAAMSLCGITDIYTHGVQSHNFNSYARPGDGRMEPMPWDWDHPFMRGTSDPLWGTYGSLVKVFARPVYARLYYGHLRDIIQTTYNASYLSPWFSHYGFHTGENYASKLSYVTARANHVLSQLPAQVPFSITSNGGAGFSVDTSMATLSGDGWIDVREILLDGAPAPVPVTWTDGDSWTIRVPVRPGNNAITLRAFDHQGNEVGSDSIQVTSTSGVEPASAANLVISEIHYHPAGDLAEEFMELRNIHPIATIDLTGVSFVAGIDFSFVSGTTLAPGGSLLVVQDTSAFNTKYGTELAVAGLFENGTRLANSGEQIRLEAPGGVLIRDFSYDDKHPWPVSPDGAGASLVLVAPSENPDHSVPGSWRPSVATGGNPGTSDATSFPGGDLIGYALAGGMPSAEVFGDQLLFSYPRNLAADDIVYVVETSDDLETWNSDPALVDIVTMQDHGDGTATVVYPVLLGASSCRFVRLALSRR